MVRALFRKEWRQLRLLRWSGLGIGLLLPPFLLALAEAGQRGWSAFGSISSYDTATVVQEALPMFLILAVWPLLALMTTAQAFAADRAAGTEAFLLQRPVRRSRIWQARAAAAMASTVLLIAAHIAIWWICVRLLGNPAAFDETATFARLVAQGALFAGIALLAGAAAAAFARSPMQAMLLGLVLAAAPVALANLLGFWYGGYSLGNLSFGYGIPVFLLAGYVVGAFRMECRGEPAGQGRLRRGLIALGVGIVAMPVFLAATAPVVMRWDAKLGLGNTTVYPAPRGRVVLALNNDQGAGWLFDTASGKRLRFFAPPVYDVAWNDEGDELAVIHAAGGSGRTLPAPRIEVFDASGSPIRRPIECDACLGWWNSGLLWAGEKIVTKAFVEGRVGVLIVDPATGERRTLSVPPGAYFDLSVIKSREDGRVFIVWLVRSPAGPSDDSTVKTAVLYRLDVKAGSLEEQATIPRVGRYYAWERALSPSGKSWLRMPSGPDGQVEIVDLETGETVVLPARTAAWLADDRLVWVEVEGTDRTVMFGRPGESRPIRSFKAAWTWFRASPDRAKLLVAIRVPEDPPRLLQWVYDPAADHWLEVQVPHADPAAWFGSAQWAGPGILAFVGQGYLALQDLEHPETLDYVIGDPGF